MYKENRLPVDYRSGNGIQTNEKINSGIAYVNHTERKRRTDYLPGSCKRSCQCSPNDRKGWEVNAHLLRQSCIIGPGHQLHSDEKINTCHKFTYALRFRFDTTNNEAEYEALIVGLRIAEQMGVKNLQANVDSRLVANQVNRTYVAKEPGMIKYLEKVKNLTSTFKEFFIKQVPKGENKKANALRKIASTSFAYLSKQKKFYHRKRKGQGLYAAKQGDAKKLIRKCNDCQVHCPVIRNQQQNLTPITSLWPFYKWGIDIARPFPEGPGKVKILIVAIDNFTKWIEAKPVATITKSQVMKFANGLVERAKRSLGEGIKARVRNISFKPGDLVYRSNEPSHAMDGGKLEPKWEGPYEVTEALGKG
uniref:Reverse transcriptase domain-containing protein n=1 Tax=Tanacetum cinerariifolium TaxID=118510 RepID=A0A6L2JRN4_TANCI|nr:reverse transcriptase domain-containing protein [Tanacetum cinerariifolium]